jgi:hypothetical protein
MAAVGAIHCFGAFGALMPFALLLLPFTLLLS